MEQDDDDVATVGAGAAMDVGKRRRTEVVTPGDVITGDVGYMRGHGTFHLNGNLIASVAGVVQQVGKSRPVVSLWCSWQSMCARCASACANEPNRCRSCAFMHNKQNTVCVCA
jgi:hypothetical protein